MNKEIVKKGYEEAEKELQERQVSKIKDIVKATLQKISDIDSDIDAKKVEIKELEEQKKFLRLDIEDLKEGRLDRIEERQTTDKKAKKTSVIIVEKEVHYHHYDRWYEPYKITYIPFPIYPTNIPLYNGIFSSSAVDNSSVTFTANCSTTKNNVIGTYAVGDKTIHLR